MLRRVASGVSLRSRERKLRLFLELYRPGPETTVLDVGVTDAPFGGGSSDNFFEALYPWPERITGVGHTELDRFAAAFPLVTAVQADGRELPFADGSFDLGFSNAVVEHVAGGRAGQRQFIAELCRVAERVFVTTPNRWFPLDPHTLLPFAHWLPPGPRRDRLFRARGFDDVLDPLGPRELAALFPYPVRIASRGMTLVAVIAVTATVAVKAPHRPVWALHVLVVGLALHNLVMAELWDAGVRGNALDVVAAWKDVLVLVALVLAIRARGRLPFDGVATDWLAVAFGAFVVLYALLPQSLLDGTASHHGVLLGLRHDGLPVAAYFLGRALDLTRADLRSVFRTILATAAAVAAFGLIDVYAIPLQWWRDSGAPGWFTDQLGFAYRALSGLPENFVYNTGDERPLRRLVSTFLSPLATSYLLVIALLVCAAWLAGDRLRGRRLGVWAALVALLGAGLLWTHSRSSILALALGLVVYGLACRPSSRAQRLAFLGAAVGVLAVGAVFVRAYPHIGPRTTFTPLELECQRANAAGDVARLNSLGCFGATQPIRLRQTEALRSDSDTGDGDKGTPTAGGLADSSTESHWQSLRDGLRTVLRHPQGFGLGNAGSTASRTGAVIEAGESTYTELGVDVGLVGGLVFLAWSSALLWRVRAAPLVLASLAAVLALGLQTDVIGVPWLACVLWALAGSRVLPSSER